MKTDLLTLATLHTQLSRQDEQLAISSTLARVATDLLIEQMDEHDSRDSWNYCTCGWCMKVRKVLRGV